MKVKVELEVEINGEYDIDDVEDYLAFKYGQNGDLSAGNPLYKNKATCEITNFYCDEIL